MLLGPDFVQQLLLLRLSICPRRLSVKEQRGSALGWAALEKAGRGEEEEEEAEFPKRRTGRSGIDSNLSKVCTHYCCLFTLKMTFEWLFSTLSEELISSLWLKVFLARLWRKPVTLEERCYVLVNLTDLTASLNSWVLLGDSVCSFCGSGARFSSFSTHRALTPTCQQLSVSCGHTVASCLYVWSHSGVSASLCKGTDFTIIQMRLHVNFLSPPSLWARLCSLDYFSAG